MLVFVACSGSDDAAPTGLTDAQREWCSFGSAALVDENRWVLIYDAGRSIGIDMEGVNAVASDLRVAYEEQGMDADESVAAVSADLFENDDFVAACREAYALNKG